MQLTRARRGLTLIELLVVLVLLSVVLGTVLSVLNKQQRYYAGASEIIEARSNIRQAADLLRSELRSLAPVSGDISGMGTNFIEYRSTIGASIICQLTDSTGNRQNIIVPPTRLTTRAGLTSWVAAPIREDTIMIFDPGADPSPVDDRWNTYVLTADATPAAVCPTTSKFTTTALEQANGWRLQIKRFDPPAAGGTGGNGITATTPTGSPIRVIRHARYEIRQGANGNWYLGYYDCQQSRATPCNAWQPVVGPFVTPTGNTAGGFLLSYYDTTNAVTADPKKVARIDVWLRARTENAINVSGFGSGVHTDSLAVSIALRNRRP